MSVNALHIFAATQIPYSGCLVTTTATKDRFMSWMPNSRVDSEIMQELADRLVRCKFVGIPNFYGLILRCRDNCLFVYVTPLTAEYFSLVSLNYCDRL